MEDIPLQRRSRYRTLTRRRVDLALYRQTRRALQRGVFGQSRAWQIVAILIVTRIAMRRIGAPRTVFRARIDAGDRLEIRGMREG